MVDKHNNSSKLDHVYSEQTKKNDASKASEKGWENLQRKEKMYIVFGILFILVMVMIIGLADVKSSEEVNSKVKFPSCVCYIKAKYTLGIKTGENLHCSVKIYNPTDTKFIGTSTLENKAFSITWVGLSNTGKEIIEVEDSVNEYLLPKKHLSWKYKDSLFSSFDEDKIRDVKRAKKWKCSVSSVKAEKPI